MKNISKPAGPAVIIESLKYINLKPSRRKIRVNVAPIMRRKSTSRTTTSLMAGRISTSFLTPRITVKKARKHDLAASKKDNVQNSGKF